MFLIPILALIGFLAIKPPAIGSEKGEVIVTPEATVTPSTKPQLRDFDDDGKRPDHFEDHFGDDDGDQSRHHHDKNHDEDRHHDDDLDDNSDG